MQRTKKRNPVKKTSGKRYGTGLPGPGRPRGSQNKATKEIRELARTFLDDEEGKKKLLEQYRSGVLAPATLALMHYYAHGKPKERVEHSTPAEGMKFTIKIDGNSDRDI